MAHNLNNTNGKYSFVAKGEKAWHGLGTYVDEPMTANEVLKLAQLDYKVEQWEMIARKFDDNGNELVMNIDKKVANVRSDTHDILGIVSPSYKILQNDECFNFFDPIIDRGEAIYETAGALGKGERVFITAKLPNDIVIGNESIEQYVLITNGHDGINALTACLTPIRVVCNNTLTAALGKNGHSNKVTIYHQKNIQDRLKEAHKVMGMASKYVNDITPIFERMSKVKISDKALKEFIQNVMMPKTEQIKDKELAMELSTRTQNTIVGIHQFAHTHETQLTKESKGTLWGAYNSISGYFNYIKDYKNASDKMHDLNFGTGSKYVQKAFDLSLNLI